MTEQQYFILLEESKIEATRQAQRPLCQTCQASPSR